MPSFKQEQVWFFEEVLQENDTQFDWPTNCLSSVLIELCAHYAYKCYCSFVEKTFEDEWTMTAQDPCICSSCQQC